MFRRHQPRKHVQPAGGDGDVVVAAAKFHAAIFDDARTPPLCAIGRRQFLEPQHAVRDAVDGLVGDVGGQVVEQQHGGAELREIVLDRQNLPPVAQRALRQQPDLGKAVQHHPARLHAIDGLENLLGGFAEFEIGRIEQALLLLGIEQALGRQQLEYDDPLVQRPAVRGRALPQFPFGFGQRDVEALLAGLCALHQELQRDRRLSGPGVTLDQEHMLPRESAGAGCRRGPRCRFSPFPQ